MSLLKESKDMKKLRVATIVTAVAVAAVTAVAINRTKHGLFDEDYGSDLFEDEDTDDVESARGRFTNVLSRVTDKIENTKVKAFTDNTEEIE